MIFIKYYPVLNANIFKRLKIYYKYAKQKNWIENYISEINLFRIFL